jgi:hypothetical protein
MKAEAEAEAKEATQDEFGQFLGSVCVVETDKHEKPLHGRVISISKDYLTVKRRTGQIVVVRKNVVGQITAIRDQPAV